MSTYWAPAPAHHAYTVSVDGGTVSDYGAYLHESQTDDAWDLEMMESLNELRRQNAQRRRNDDSGQGEIPE